MTLRYRVLVGLKPHAASTALAIALAGMLLAAPAEACSCGSSGPPCVAFSTTPVIFTGRVTRLSEAGLPDRAGDFRDRTVQFEVEESFRGQPRKIIEVMTGYGGGDCGVLFRRGERYVVYAGALPETGRLYTSICSRTSPVSQAGADLDFLRGRGDPARGSGVEGTIFEVGRDPKTNDTPSVGMMKGVRVVVEGSGKRWETTTDGEGWFRQWGLPPGEYVVRAVLPSRFVPQATTLRIARETCGWVHMLATPYAFPNVK